MTIEIPGGLAVVVLAPQIGWAWNGDTTDTQWMNPYSVIAALMAVVAAVHSVVFCGLAAMEAALYATMSARGQPSMKRTWCSR